MTALKLALAATITISYAAATLIQLGTVAGTRVTLEQFGATQKAREHVPPLNPLSRLLIALAALAGLALALIELT